MGLLQMGWRRRVQTVSNEQRGEDAESSQDADESRGDAQRGRGIGLLLRYW